jgi:E3 ubiquitin-protein ligase UBR4
MRDVKNHICRTLGLDGLLDDDLGLELLVAGNLVALDVPVSACYTHVWLPHQQAAAQQPQPLRIRSAQSQTGPPPMVVIFRLQGLDGDATEPTVSLADIQARAGSSEDNAEDAQVSARLSAIHNASAGWMPILTAARRWRLGQRGSLSVPSHEDAASDATQQPAAVAKAPSAEAQEAASCALRLLDAASRSVTGRAALTAARALPVLEEAAAWALTAHSSQTGSTASSSVAEALLTCIERLLDDSQGFQDSSSTVLDDASACTRASAFWTHLLRACGAGRGTTTGTGAPAVARVLARLAHGSEGAAAHLVSCLMPAIVSIRDAAACNSDGDAARQTATRADVAATVAMLCVGNSSRASSSQQGSSDDNHLRARIVAAGAADAVMDALLALRSSSTNTAEETSPLLPPALALLSGLATRCTAAGWAVHARASSDSATDLLAILHGWEGVTTGGLGTSAEAALDALAGCGCAPLLSSITTLRASTKEAQRARALAWREATLKEMGMTRAPGPGGMASPGSSPWGGSDRIVAVASSYSSLTGGNSGEDSGWNGDGDDEEEGDSGAGPCAVCQEGYRLQPAEMLGVYVFVKRVPLSPGDQALAAALLPVPPQSAEPRGGPGGASLAALLGLDPGASSSSSSSGSGGDGCASTSHFNAIHVTCHTSARRADAALKTPKREWDGATTRNHGTRCNALLPLRSHAVAQAQYDAACDSYWTAVSNATHALPRCARPPGLAPEEVHFARAVAAMHDVALLLRRLAWGASLTVDAKGGTPLSNCCLAVALTQLATEALVVAGTGVQARLRAQLSAWSSNRDVRPSAPPDGNLGYAMALSLALQSLSQWRVQRVAVFEDAIRAAVADKGACDAACSAGVSRRHVSSDPGDETQVWQLARPFVVWAALFDVLHHIVKPPTAGSADTGESAAVEEAAVYLRQNLSASLDKARELSDTLAELRRSEDLHEALDLIDALQDVVPAAARGDADAAGVWMMMRAKRTPQ